MPYDKYRNWGKRSLSDNEIKGQVIKDLEETVDPTEKLEILGHKVKIERVTGQAKDGLRWKENRLVVWLTFDEPVVVVSSFAVVLPVRKYKRDEFLYDVLRLGCEEVKREWEIDERQERQAAIDAVAAEVQKLIE